MSRDDENMDEFPVEEDVPSWTCTFCGNDEMWFDRSVWYDSNGNELQSMTDRCTQCGREVNEVPGSNVEENFGHECGVDEAME
jgi:hypothetical protein